MAIIEAQGLNIEFPLYHVASRSLKKRLLAKAAVLQQLPLDGLKHRPERGFLDGDGYFLAPSLS